MMSAEREAGVAPGEPGDNAVNAMDSALPNGNLEMGDNSEATQMPIPPRDSMLAQLTNMLDAFRLEMHATYGNPQQGNVQQQTRENPMDGTTGPPGINRPGTNGTGKVVLEE